MASLAADEGDLFQALPGAPFAAGRPVGQARPSWDGQEPIALGLGSSAPAERAPAPTQSNVADHVAPNARADVELLQAVTALRVGSQGNQGPGTTGLEGPFPVDLTYTPVFPKAERALAGQPFTYEFTAEVDANVLPITPCELGEPTWQWGVGAGFSSSPVGPFVDPPYGSWSDSFSTPNSPATALTFTTQLEGHWEFIVGVTVEYQDSCANVWTGQGQVTLVESTFGAVAPPFKMESMPNSAVAIRNDYVEQIGTAEVLKGWDVRYTAPPGGATQWQVRRVGEANWQWFRKGDVPIQANPIVWTENSVGEFDVRYARGQEFDKFSGARRIKVIEPQLVSFTLTEGGQYTKAGYHVDRPPAMDPAVTFAGSIRATAASPTSDKIRWGFVQSVEFLLNVTRNWNLITWRPGTPDGTTVEFPSRFSAQSTPTRKNDSAVGKQLYTGETSFALGLFPQSRYDNPYVPNLSFQNPKDSLEQTVRVDYDRNQHSGESWGFVTWVVVLNLETQQYTPLRQIPWTLQIDTTQDGPWQAVVGGAADPTKPVEATESIDKYLSSTAQ